MRLRHASTSTACRSYSRRMHSLPITKEKRNEQITIKQIAKNEGFLTQIIDNLNVNILREISTPRATQNCKKHNKCVTFTHSTHLLNKVTNLLHNTPINIAFKDTSTILQSTRTANMRVDTRKTSVIYCINVTYMEQTDRDIKTLRKQHRRYSKTNNQRSACDTHILDNKHEYGPTHNSIKLTKPCSKSKLMNCWKTFT